MIGRLEGRSFSAIALAVLITVALVGDARAQNWDRDRENGVGGGPAGAPDRVAAQQGPAKETGRSGDKVGFRIIIDSVEKPAIRPAEGVPVSPFSDERSPQSTTAPQPAGNAKAVAAVAQEEATAAVAALLAEGRNAPAASSVDPSAAATRSTPPTALELLRGAPSRSIATTEVAALPSAAAAPRPAARPTVPGDVASPLPTPIEQAQFSPNAAAAPKAILPPRRSEARSATRAAPVILPSPRKPGQPPAIVQQALIAPNVAASPKEKVLRTAPAPDNALVQLVQPTSDYSLTVAAGTGQVLVLGKPVYEVFVADPNVADVKALSPTKIVVHGNKLGRTNVYGFGDGGDVVFAMDVDTVPNADVAAAQVKSAAPASATEVSLNSGTLIAEGRVADVGEAIELANVTEGLQQTQGPTINNTTIEGSQQVNIRVRFAEVSRNDVFQLGINWEALVNSGDFLFGLSTGNFLSSVGDLSARDIASLNDEQFGRIDFTGEFGDVSVDAFIDALQREGILNLLAEPNLTSSNGEPANFLAGGEVPILVPGGAGGDTVTIQYKPFGVTLDFIPTILPGERINLRVRPEVSSISAAGSVILDGFQVPAFAVRRADTSIELASGQTFAIAGLFQRELATDTDKFPVLGDVPILGQLFQSERFQRKETELVILITPYLVQPTSTRDLALPNDRLDSSAKPLARTDKKRAGFIVN